MLKETIKKYYIDENCNCAESMLKAIDEVHGLAIPAESFKLISGFGGGMCAGYTCGALTGAQAALGKMFSNGKAHETEGFMEMCGAFVNSFKAEMGTLNCSELKPQYFKEDGTRCMECVFKTADIFEEFLKEKTIK